MYIDENFDLESGRVAFCTFCQKQTEQRIEQRIIDHFPKHSPTHNYHSEELDCWWCNECDEHVEDIVSGKF